MRRGVYRAVLKLVYPAESAVRRLIVMAMSGVAEMVVVPPSPRLPGVPPKFRPPRERKPVDTPALRIDDPRIDPEAGLKGRWSKGGEPRITDLGSGMPWDRPPPRPPAPVAPSDDDLMDAEPLLRRLRSLKAALDDLAGHARRMRRWEARRKAAAKKPDTAMRMGMPPGWRRSRKKRPIDVILWDFHEMAFYEVHSPVPP